MRHWTDLSEKGLLLLVTAMAGLTVFYGCAKQEVAPTDGETTEIKVEETTEASDDMDLKALETELLNVAPSESAATTGDEMEAAAATTGDEAVAVDMGSATTGNEVSVDMGSATTGDDAAASVGEAATTGDEGADVKIEISEEAGNKTTMTLPSKSSSFFFNV